MVDRRSRSGAGRKTCASLSGHAACRSGPGRLALNRGEELVERRAAAGARPASARRRSRSPIWRWVRPSSKRRRSASRSAVVELDGARRESAPRPRRTRDRWLGIVSENGWRLVLAVDGRGPVERDRGPGASRPPAPRAPCSTSRPESAGDLRDRRLAPVLGPEARRDRVDRGDLLLEAAGDPHRLGVVAEMVLERAEDERGRVAREADVAVGVEPVDGLDEALVGDLEQVVERLHAGAVATGERTWRAAGTARSAARAVRGSRVAREPLDQVAVASVAAGRLARVLGRPWSCRWWV